MSTGLYQQLEAALPRDDRVRVLIQTAACGLRLDCLDEVVTIMHPRQVRLGRVAAPATDVRLRADEAESVWQLAGAPPDAPTVTVAGPANSLALLVWGRVTPDDPAITITGDRAELVEVLAAGLTP